MKDRRRVAERPAARLWLLNSNPFSVRLAFTVDNPSKCCHSLSCVQNINNSVEQRTSPVRVLIRNDIARDRLSQADHRTSIVQPNLFTIHPVKAMTARSPRRCRLGPARTTYTQCRIQHCTQLMLAKSGLRCV